MKILFFDSNSLWVCARRMEQGRLHWPASEDSRVQLTREEFALLIGGIDLTTTTRRKWYPDPSTMVLPGRVRSSLRVGLCIGCYERMVLTP